VKKAWAWLTGLPKYWLIPSIALALGAMWAFFRPSRPRTTLGPGISPKAGREAMREIRTASEAEARRIDEHSAAERAKIEKDWGDSLCVLLLATLALSGCASGIPAPKATPWPGALTAPHMALSEGCSYADEDHLVVQCPGPLFAKSLIEILDQRDSLAHVTRRLNESLKVSNILKDIAAAKIAAAEAATDDAKAQRWLFGGVGAAVGVVASIVAYALAK